MLKLTPPLGWNTWNTFGLTINEKLILANLCLTLSGPLLYILSGQELDELYRHLA